MFWQLSQKSVYESYVLYLRFICSFENDWQRKKSRFQNPKRSEHRALDRNKDTITIHQSD